MRKRFSEVYHLYCEAVEESIQETLGRPLTKAEHDGIWNAGSLLLLEALERDFVHAQSLEERERLLTQQVRTAKETVERVGGNLRAQVAGLLQRSLSPEEERKLRTLQMVEEAMHIAEQLLGTPGSEREAVFRLLLEKI